MSAPDRALTERARAIKLLVLDCDGVLTDGTLYYGEDGSVQKRFNVQDGLGIKLAQSAGLEFAVISGLSHAGVEKRVRDLGITRYQGGHHRKVPLLDQFRTELGLGWEQVAFMGDDWVDAAVMRKVGLPLSVPNAQPEILELAAWVSSRPGGQGAVREAVNLLLRAQGLYQDLWQQWRD